MAKATAGGSRYEVLVGLSYPTDPDIITRIQSGAHVPLHERRARRAEPGEIVSDIPAMSVPWLLERGIIRPAGAASAAPAVEADKVVEIVEATAPGDDFQVFRRSDDEEAMTDG
jgi:hypothetical protein